MVAPKEMQSQTTGKYVCMKMAQIESFPKHMGTTSFLPPASRVRGQERHQSCHPLPESKLGLGQQRSTFRFCSGITQFSPALFQLGQELLNRKHFHVQHTPVPEVQGAPSTSSSTAHYEHLALASYRCGLLGPFLLSRCPLACRDQSVVDWL